MGYNSILFINYLCSQTLFMLSKHIHIHRIDKPHSSFWGNFMFFVGSNFGWQAGSRLKIIIIIKENVNVKR